MDTNIIGQSSTGQTVSTAKFAPIYAFGSSFGTTANAASSSVMPVAGTLRNLYVKMDVADNAQTRTFTVQKSTNNGSSYSDTAITITLSTTVTSGNDTTHTDTFNAGDMYTLKTTASNTTASTATIRWTLLATAAPYKSMLLGSGSATLATGGTTTCVMHGQGSDSSGVVANVESVIPADGTLKNAYVALSGAPGAGGSGKNYVFTLFKNGGSTSIVVTVSETAVSASDTTHSVSVSAGDRLYWSCAQNNGPTARTHQVGIEFDPSTNGESVHMFANSNAQTNSAVRYNTLAANATTAYGNTESLRESQTQAAIWKKLYVYEQTILSAGTYQYQPQYNASSGNITVTANTSTQAFNDTTHIDTTNAGDTIAMKITPASTPTAVQVEWGIVSFIKPPSELALTGVG